jgi:branched-chain amino acid transport system substrate-binding protein
VARENKEGTLLIGRQALRDALYSMSNFYGLTGLLSCDEYGDCANTVIAINQIKNGDIVRIWPEE